VKAVPSWKRSMARFTARTIEGARPGDYSSFVEPALATLRDRVPQGADWSHELKFDGYRAQLHVRGEDVRVFTRRGYDWTGKFTTIVAEAALLAANEAIIDGEVIVTDEEGNVSFGALVSDLRKGRTDRLTYYAFDLLYLDGFDLRPAAQSERRRVLAELLAASPRTSIFFSEAVEIQRSKLFERICALGLEGIVSKDGNAPYRSGRTSSWIKIKCVKREALPIIGFVPATRTVAALYLGRWDGDELAYAGKVGTGFTEQTGRALRTQLDEVVVSKSPVKNLRKPRAVWVQPVYEADVQYGEITDDGELRHASYKGLAKSKVQVIEEPKPDARLSRANVQRELEGAVAPAADVLRDYWRSVHEQALPYLGGRPLTLVRHAGGKVFFHKGGLPALPEAVHSLTIQKREGGEGTRLWVDSLEGLLGLVDLGVVEIHPWQARVSDIERADLIAFDLDPGDGVEWKFVTDTALLLHDFLQAEGLECWAKTSGGKGLHIMAPLQKPCSHDDARHFARELAEEFSSADERYITSSAPARRAGRIFIDYLRNGRGTTTVGAFSPRARIGFPVSMPVSWQEVAAGVGADAFTVDSFTPQPGYHESRYD
jgi:bifunctional non-homologous end joining protein LigD